ncbi:MAG: glycosyltransferase family protein [Lachnospiraceae bacterium]|nr:glycosyltransferase family protein [Lachnospiraceae bacterium]
MNERKICFIMCVNNERYANEQIRYLNSLYVPEGYEIDVLAVQGATSMTAGYNEAMRSTDAKYKVYMHQDVFIVNKNFITDILRIFEDEQVGMLGMVGAPKLPENCIMWNAPRVGKLYFNMNYQSGESIIGEFEGKYAEVEALDGLLMATQYDVPWREDLFTKWDFYDISQSQEFLRAGYKVVVPNQEEPWCIHDDGFFNLKNYYVSRKIFVDEYKK